MRAIQTETLVHRCRGMMDEGLFVRVWARVCSLQMYVPGFEGIRMCLNLKAHIEENVCLGMWHVCIMVCTTVYGWMDVVGMFARTVQGEPVSGTLHCHLSVKVTRV